MYMHNEVRGTPARHMFNPPYNLLCVITYMYVITYVSGQSVCPLVILLTCQFVSLFVSGICPIHCIMTFIIAHAHCQYFCLYS